MKTSLLCIAIAILIAGCSAPPTSPKDLVIVEGPGVDSVKMFFNNYAAGNWSNLRSIYQDTASIYHNGAEKMSADSVVSFHTSRRQLYDKVEANIIHAQETKYADGSKWRNAWGELNLTIKGSGEVIKLPIHMAWLMAGNKVGLEMAYYDRLAIYQAVTRANEAAATKK
jgi:hypothetical protein